MSVLPPHHKSPLRLGLLAAEAARLQLEHQLHVPHCVCPGGGQQLSVLETVISALEICVLIS